MNRFVKLTVAFIGAIWLGSLLGCQSQVELVTITREVEVTRPVLADAALEVTREVIVTREVPVEVEVTRLVELPEVDQRVPGDPERPFQLVFLPGSVPQLVEVRGGMLIDALAEETGYAFEIVIPSDSLETVEFICSRPQETIAFLLPIDYIFAADRCDAQLTHAALRFGVPYRLGMLVSRRDRVINVFADLAFKTVGVPSFEELATYGLFAREVAAQELPGVEYVQYGTSSAALIALLEGEIDVAAAGFNPPLMGERDGSRQVWRLGEDSPEIWRELGVEPDRDPIGYVEVAGGPEFGGYRIRDDRAALFDVYPEIFAETRIIALSDPVPNEAVVFSRDFPFAAALRIGSALEAFTNSEACAQSVCASDFYRWSGMMPVDETLYALIREIEIDPPPAPPQE